MAGALVWIADKLLAPALVAVVFSWITTLVLESHRARRDVLTKQVESVRSDLLALWALAAAYWSRDAEEQDGLVEQQILLVEQDLRFTAMDVASKLRTISDQEMADLLADVSGAITSGNFGDPARKKSPAQVSRLRRAIVALRLAIMQARAASLGRTFSLGH
jgi:hypothetical protein